MNKMVILNLKVDHEDSSEYVCDFFIEKDGIIPQYGYKLCHYVYDKINYILTEKFGKKNLLNTRWATVFPRVVRVGEVFKLLIFYNEKSDYTITNFILNILSHSPSIFSTPPVDYLYTLDAESIWRVLRLMDLKILRKDFEIKAPDMKFLQKSRRVIFQDNEFFIFFNSTNDLSIIDFDTLFMSFSDSPELMNFLEREYNEKNILSINGELKENKGSLNIVMVR